MSDKKSLFSILKEHKIEVVVVGGLAVLCAASLLTKRRLVQPGALGGYHAWTQHHVSAHVVMLGANKPKLTGMLSDIWDWSTMGIAKGRVRSIADDVDKMLLAPVKTLYLSFPFCGFAVLRFCGFAVLRFWVEPRSCLA